MSSFKKLAVKSAFLNVCGGVSQTIIRLLASMVLARVLDPFDFGIMGMGMIVLNFLGLMTGMGIGAAVVAEPNLSDKHLSSAFWFMFVVRLLFFVIAFLGAPIFALYFNEPRFVGAFRAMSFVFLISAISSISVPLLTKRMEFFKLNMLQILSVLMESSLAIFLAVKFDLHYWSLIFAMLVSSIFLQVSLFYFAGWKPAFCFSFDFLGIFKKYITNGLGSSFLVYLLGNIDYLIVGRFLGTKILGFYEFAYRIPFLFFQRFIQPLNGVLFPVLSNVSEMNKRKVAIIKVFEIIVFVSFPVLSFLCIFSREIVLFLWGEKWLVVSPILAILSVAALIECVISPRTAIFLSSQRPDLNFKCNLMHVLFTFLFVFFLTKKFALIGTAFGMLLGLIGPLFFFSFSLKMVNISIFSFLKRISFFSAISFFLAVFLKYYFFTIFDNLYVSLFFVFLLYVFFYVSLCFLFYRSSLLEILSLLRFVFLKS